MRRFPNKVLNIELLNRMDGDNDEIDNDANETESYKFPFCYTTVSYLIINSPKTPTLHGLVVRAAKLKWMLC